jgi:hypothetical protein
LAFSGFVFFVIGGLSEIGTGTAADSLASQRLVQVEFGHWDHPLKIRSRQYLEIALPGFHEHEAQA